VTIIFAYTFCRTPVIPMPYLYKQDWKGVPFAVHSNCKVILCATLRISASVTLVSIMGNYKALVCVRLQWHTLNTKFHENPIPSYVAETILCKDGSTTSSAERRDRLTLRAHKCSSLTLKSTEHLIILYELLRLFLLYLVFRLYDLWVFLTAARIVQVPHMVLISQKNANDGRQEMFCNYNISSIFLYIIL
jgi:hypothetical protein